MGRCGAAEGCLYPASLADAEGKIGVNFRTCDFKAQPITVSGTTALPPDITRTRDMAAWTSGAPLSKEWTLSNELHSHIDCTEPNNWAMATHWPPSV